MPGLTSALKQRLDCPVEIADPFRKVAVGGRVDRCADRRVRPVAGGGDRTGDAPSGGQMIRINLLPVEEAQAAAGRRNELFRTAFVALSFALIITVAHVAQWVSLTRASGEVERLTKNCFRSRDRTQACRRSRRRSVSCARS